MGQTLDDLLGKFGPTEQLATTLTRALSYARQQDHRAMSLEHVLLALSEDPDASVVLQACDVDLNRLKTDVGSYLGRLEERFQDDQGGAPSPHDDLVRILRVAHAAAKQRNRAPNGGLLLAAIVGDGRSPAANMLRSQGLTFDAAVKALQSANAQLRSAPQTEAVAPEPSDQAAASADSVPVLNGSAPHAEPAPSALADPPAPTNMRQILDDARRRVEATKPLRREGPRPAPSDGDTLARLNRTTRSGAVGGPPEPSETPEKSPAAPVRPADPQQVRQRQPVPPTQTAQPTVPQPPARPADPVAAAANAPRPSVPPAPPANAAQPPPAAPPQALRPPPVPPGEQPPTPAPAQGRTPPPRPQSNEQTARPGPHQPPRPAPGPSATGYGPPNGQHPHGARRPTQPMPQPSSRGPVQARPAPAPAQEPAAPLQPPVQQSHPDLPGAAAIKAAVPRRLRLGDSELVEVRIARHEIELISGRGVDGSTGRPAQRRDFVVAKAMTLRMRAPEGGLHVEATSPETQWLEQRLGLLMDDSIIWRWLITPSETGSNALQIAASLRTVTSDGMATETALPPEIIKVRVRQRPGRVVARIAGWSIAAALGALAYYFAPAVIELAAPLLAQ